MLKFLLISLVLTQTVLSAQIQERKSQEICGFCVLVFNRIQGVLQQNTTEQQIKSLLNNVCQGLPDDQDKQNCLAAIEKSFLSIYNLIRSNLDPGIICRYLKACDDSRSTFLTSLLNGNNSLKCDLCYVAIDIVDHELKNNQTEEAIANQLKNLCKLLPENSLIHNECLNVVTQFAPVIMNIVGDDLNPDTVCHFLEFCTDSSTSLSRPISNGLECNVCSTLVQIFDVLIRLNATGQNVVNFIGLNVCNSLFKDQEIKRQCEAFVAEYGGAILDILAKDLEPTKVCSILRVCNSTSHKVNYLPASLINTKDLLAIVQRKRNNLLNTIECELCTYLVKLVDTFLQKNKTEEEIFDELSKVCNVFSTDIKEQCFAFVNEYGPYVVYLLVNEIQPDSVCRAIRFCNSSPRKYFFN